MITVVGAGFAGTEAAWAIASRGVPVRVYEMRPAQMTPAHTTGYFAELVCSNSLKSMLPTSPAGQLKAEMAALGSIVLEIAHEHSVPAGEALGVDRDAFGSAITKILSEHPLIDVCPEPFTPPMAEAILADKDQILILATGPLTTPDMAEWLAQLSGRTHLYFYDAVSPTVDASTIDTGIAFAQSRYDKGEGADYLNCPFEKDDYLAFVEALVNAERVPIRAFEAGGKRDGGEPESLEETFVEKVKYFAGCTPIEAIAEKGVRSLAFGNFKPVGLTDPRTGRRPYAALQLRPENREKTLYSLVACQNRLKWGEQKRIFRMVPGLANAEFVRFGVIHRNTYLEAPTVLTPYLEVKNRTNLFVAGQLTGVEGYVESAAMGILVGLHALARSRGQELTNPPRATAYGGLLAHLQDSTPREFAPMNVNWGLFPAPEIVTRDKSILRAAKLKAAQDAMAPFVASIATA
jgi:methylenetetrahydrofolate--tRNA-(uracil-5-)-methyltransferase